MLEFTPVNILNFNFTVTKKLRFHKINALREYHARFYIWDKRYYRHQIGTTMCAFDRIAYVWSRAIVKVDVQRNFDSEYLKSGDRLGNVTDAINYNVLSIAIFTIDMDTFRLRISSHKLIMTDTEDLQLTTSISSLQYQNITRRFEQIQANGAIVDVCTEYRFFYQISRSNSKSPIFALNEP